MRAIAASTWKPLDGLRPELAARESAERATLRRTAQDFSAILLNQMLSAQRATIDSAEFGHGGRGEEIFTGMLDTELANRMAARDSALTGMIEGQFARAMRGYATQEARRSMP